PGLLCYTLFEPWRTSWCVVVWCFNFTTGSLRLLFFFPPVLFHFTINQEFLPVSAASAFRLYVTTAGVTFVYQVVLRAAEGAQETDVNKEHLICPI
ncbi:MAG: hypothetical protein IJ343_02835, partial [Clostridia bacterium]|nr:hypothetical protein [Clostridia bacterium]